MSNNEKEKGFSSSNINWFPGHMSKSLREIESNLKLVDIIIEIVDAIIATKKDVKILFVVQICIYKFNFLNSSVGFLFIPL